MLESLRPHFDALGGGRKQFKAGDILFQRDERVQWLHFIERGRVHLLRYQGAGNVTVLQRAEPGYFLAEASLFSERYHCEGRAISNTEVTRYARSAVLQAIHSAPGFASAWALYLSREVQRTRARAEILSLRRLSDRLDAWLAENGSTLPPKGSWRGLAREIGVSPEALYRHLSITFRSRR